MKDNIDFITLIVALINTSGLLILGWLNYRVKKQSKQLQQLKGICKPILQNALGFLELESKYHQELSNHLNKTSDAIKKEYRNNLVMRINSDYSGEAKIKNLIEQVENIF